MKRNIFFGFLVLLGACTEDSAGVPFGLHGQSSYPISNYELLKKGNWVISSKTVYPPLNGKTDLFPDYPDCQKDDTLLFRKYDELLVRNATNRCTTGEPAEQTYTWLLRGSDGICMDSKWYSIKTLTSDDAVFETTDTVNSVVYTYSVGYSNRK